jgi:hypothetical protein
MLLLMLSYLFISFPALFVTMELRTLKEQLWHSYHTVRIRQAYQNILKR